MRVCAAVSVYKVRQPLRTTWFEIVVFLRCFLFRAPKSKKVRTRLKEAEVNLKRSVRNKSKLKYDYLMRMSG